MTDLPRYGPELLDLIALFNDSAEPLGRFEEVSAAGMPGPYASLLAHDKHMTVTVERFHNCPVDVQVLATNVRGKRYARKILLTRQSDGKVVQFGIMQVNFSYLDPDVQREIESERIPLGRVLIAHDVLREIFLAALWKVTAGEELSRLMGMSPGEVTYGRTAIIECNGEPAIELLEIVSPVENEAAD